MLQKNYCAGLFLLFFHAMAFASLDISEIRTDQPGSDNDEYFEVFANSFIADLSAYSYLVLGDGSGGSGVIEVVYNFPTVALNAGDVFVVAESSFSLGTADATASLNFENSDNLTHLLVTGFTGSNGDDLDTNDDGTLDSTPWATVIDAVAMISETNPPSNTEFEYASVLGGSVVGPDGSSVPGHIYRDAAGAWQIGQFDPVMGDDTPGSVAAVPEPSAFALLFLVGSVVVTGRRLSRWLGNRKTISE